MQIGRLAARSGVTAKTLRFYESAGVLEPPRRTPAGYRDYDESALDRLRFVRAAQAAGLSLAEIRDIISARAQQGPPCTHVTALLDRNAAELRTRIADMSRTLGELEGLLSRARSLDPSRCGPDDVCHVIRGR